MKATKVLHKHKALTPKLRFKEFSGEWQVNSLSELLEFKNGINASKEQYGSGIKFINVLDILNSEYITYDSIIGSVNVDENVASKYPVNYGDILFQRSSETRKEVGTACVYLDRVKTAVFGGFVIRGRKNGEYDPIFLNKLLKTDVSRNEITSKSGGSTRYNVGQETLSSVVLNFPSLPEQQKIASFLSTVDEKIQQLTQKKDFLEQYKTGVMQKLFSGKMRFKDESGKTFPKWEEKRLGLLTEVVVGGTPRTNIPEYWDGQIPWLSSGELKNGEIQNPLKFITELGLQKSSAKLMPKGTVLLAMTGATLGRIGFLTFQSSGNQSIAGFLPRQTFNSKYLFYNLQFNFQLILSFAGGAAQPGINKNTIENLQLSFPLIEEQKKIAYYLSNIDNKIESVNKQITQTQTFKKGLLQQMFV